jgi:hypothetical protein
MSTTDDKFPVLHKEYASIFGKDKSGKTRVWKATVFSFQTSNPQMCKAMSVIQHGIYEGKLQLDTREYTEGKNIGKKNETTPLQQCMAEVEKKRKDKMEKEGYSETISVNMLLEETISHSPTKLPLVGANFAPTELVSLKNHSTPTLISPIRSRVCDPPHYGVLHSRWFTIE